MPVLMAVGALLFMVGVGTIMIVVFGSGGAAKSQQLRVMGEVARGGHGRGKRLAFLFGLVAIGIGALTLFAGVEAGDAKRRKACTAYCKQEGYESGRIGPSTARDPHAPARAAFVACTCSGAEKEPREIDARDLAKK